MYFHGLKKFLFLTIFIVTLFSTNNFAQNKGFGLGIMVGSPSSISAKYWIGGNNAIDGGLGYSLINNESFSIHMDYLYHHYEFSADKVNLPIYYGVGFRLKSKDKHESSLGVRGVLGLSYFGKSAPYDIFIEIAPVFKLVPKTSLDIDAAIGARYFFN